MQEQQVQRERPTLITVRVGSGKRRHAATEDGRGLCAAAMRAVLFSGARVVKVADGVVGVDCGTCWSSGLAYARGRRIVAR